MRFSTHTGWLLVLGSLGAACHAQEDGKRLFISGATPSCTLCHTLKDAGAEGTVGPSLDELRPDAQRVVKALKNGIGQMPAFRTLSEEQIQAIARYVEQVAGK